MYCKYVVEITEKGFVVDIEDVQGAITPRMLIKASDQVQKAFRQRNAALIKQAAAEKAKADKEAAEAAAVAASEQRTQDLNNAAAIAAGEARFAVVAIEEVDELETPTPDQEDEPPKDESPAEKLERLKAEGKV